MLHAAKGGGGGGGAHVPAEAEVGLACARLDGQQRLFSLYCFLLRCFVHVCPVPCLLHCRQPFLGSLLSQSLKTFPIMKKKNFGHIHL